MRTNHSPISHDIQYKIDHQKNKEEKKPMPTCFIFIHVFVLLRKTRIIIVF